MYIYMIWDNEWYIFIYIVYINLLYVDEETTVYLLIYIECFIYLIF